MATDQEVTMVSKQSNSGQTFAFLQFEQQESANTAMTLSGMQLGDRAIRINPAKLPPAVIRTYMETMQKANEVQARLLARMAERKAKEEAEQKARQEAELKYKQEAAERKVREEAAELRRQEQAAERKAKEEADAAARAERRDKDRQERDEGRGRAASPLRRLSDEERDRERNRERERQKDRERERERGGVRSGDEGGYRRERGDWDDRGRHDGGRYGHAPGRHRYR